MQWPLLLLLQGTFLIYNSLARVLIDSGTSHSFISSSFVHALGLKTELLDFFLCVENLVGGKVLLDRVCQACDLVIADHLFSFDFVVLEMDVFDVILGIDWLSTFRATIDCFRRRVSICTLEGVCFQFFRELSDSSLTHLCEMFGVYAILWMCFPMSYRAYCLIGRLNFVLSWNRVPSLFQWHLIILHKQNWRS